MDEDVKGKVIRLIVFRTENGCKLIEDLYEGKVEAFFRKNGDMGALLKERVMRALKDGHTIAIEYPGTE